MDDFRFLIRPQRMEHICYASEAVSLGCEKKVKIFFLVIPSSLSCGKVDCWSPSRCFHSLTEVPGKGKKEAAVWSADWQTAQAPTVVVEKN